MTEKATPTNLYGLQRRFSNRRPFLQNVYYAILLIAPLFTLAPGAMANEAPLQIFEGVNYQGTWSTVKTHTIFSGGTIPNGLDKKISSSI